MYRKEVLVQNLFAAKSIPYAALALLCVSAGVLTSAFPRLLYQLGAASGRHWQGIEGQEKQSWAISLPLCFKQSPGSRGYLL